jgi:hypothetical protein
MFEKIGIAAEKLATNVSESRRGFLVGLGKAALGVTGVVAGLLALPTQATGRATSSGRAAALIYNGYCQAGLQIYGASAGLTGYCVCNNPCRRQYNPEACHGYGQSIISFCGYRVAGNRPCHCT